MTTPQPDPLSDSTPQEFLTFVVNAQDYAIAISDILEIKNWQTPTPLPGAPSAHLGIINLRGHIVPVLDLVPLLHLTTSEMAESRALLIVSVEGVPVGLKVDSVSDIIEVSSAQVADVPTLNETGAPALVTQIATIESALVRIVKIGNLSHSIARSA